ncbi:helix-hairpin-helix domain-containing protein [Celeribacter halophilus]|uniref:Predicted 5' DNA nuclease, flap endonuclease-1-like, helix-3-turn-helix (H3TH) domain n=1 Tax=Celeribacter halophilus TaxID=576117 RepID=A0A1I3N5C7_9RHOB|nr:helix-hairpin-helix domain-containing protein [Celeribacter halophilus]PZX15646.1 putative flap endonuclease-1-like 5' DNA nuclease [Celeribacter halophilus]SFJ04046.1 Predicted 5' DNA nuclease, flap endonuclease-1-like, helix-3-turn-helix (H3TH) domain [Celeribacter halophilus]
MTEAMKAKMPKIGLIAAICGILAFLALMWIAGYSTGASFIVGVLVACLVAILLWIGWYEEDAPETVGKPEAEVSSAGLMQTTGIGDEPVSAADEIAPEPHTTDTKEVRSAAAAAAPEADPVEEDTAVDVAPVDKVAAEPVVTEEVEDTAAEEGIVTETVAEEAVAPEETPAVSASKATGAPDDLKAIKGVGPKIEAQLHERGITTYAQVAALGSDDIETLGEAIKGASTARLTKWVEQAKILAAGGETEFSKRVKDGDVY